MMTLMLVVLVAVFIINLTILYLMAQYLGVRLVFDDKRRRTQAAPDPLSTPMTPEDEERIREMRKRSEAELEAFQDIMSYNPSIAYGIVQDDGKEQ